MNTYTTQITLVRDDDGEHCVVSYADDLIWIADELMAEARDPDRRRIPGDLDVDGETISFGTPGEGLGRVTYRLVGHDPEYRGHIAERVWHNNGESA